MRSRIFNSSGAEDAILQILLKQLADGRSILKAALPRR